MTDQPTIAPATDAEINRLEESMERMRRMDIDEVEPAEYMRILDRLVELRRRRDAEATHD